MAVPGLDPGIVPAIHVFPIGSRVRQAGLAGRTRSGGAERASPSSSWRRNFQTAAAVKDAPFMRAAARRSPQAILDSGSGLENGRGKSSTARCVLRGRCSSDWHYETAYLGDKCRNPRNPDFTGGFSAATHSLSWSAWPPRAKPRWFISIALRSRYSRSTSSSGVLSRLASSSGVLRRSTASWP